MKRSDRLLRLIERQPGNVIFRAEIAELGSPAQITAALNALIAKGVIVRISRKITVGGRTLGYEHNWQRLTPGA